ncbi:WhiB family transcriptional regulator [Rhodococcus sp. G-MC3]|uniref:WhiB family transcriptional regulator n=1 Tax=Rhodococcus sp. G-MC3 TaxID=3046209 RepID=UPI0024BAAABF|nr:WhiB family transcriptional regulator [Rhodococcus sp. G-MC3]MDJ0393301.1 WhiB family transcriptional regulator [Rhodococcus sp. G-MC3]
MAPTTQAWQWQLDAVCRGNGPVGHCAGSDPISDVFFSPSGEGRTARRHREDEAKVVCNRCPVLAQCRQFALETNEPFGVWGGMTARERSLGRTAARLAG